MEKHNKNTKTENKDLKINNPKHIKYNTIKKQACFLQTAI